MASLSLCPAWNWVDKLQVERTSFAFKGKMTFTCQGPFPPYDGVYLHAVPKTAVVTVYYFVPGKWLDE